jgi:ABC-type multidrug transport system fused ATPase/permease subunit
MKISNINLLARLWVQLSRQHRRKFLYLIPLTGISSIAEILSLSIILPYLSVLSAPDNILNSPIISIVFKIIGSHTKEELVLIFTVALVIATILSITLRLTLVWANAKISLQASGELGTELYRRILYQPYIYHITQNSSETLSLVGGKISASITYLHQCSAILSSIFIILSLIFTLIVIDPLTTISSIFFFGLSYFIIAFIVKLRLRFAGELISSQAPYTIKAVQEGLGGIRNVILDNNQEYYCTLFDSAGKKIRDASTSIMLMSSAPRFLLEAIGVTFIVSFAYTMFKSGAELDNLIPVLGALAFGAQRILPMMHGVYSSWTTIIANEKNVSDVLSVLEQSESFNKSFLLATPIKFNNYIQLNSVKFKYPNQNSFQIKNVNLTIKKGDKIGIVGVTGSGKSTLLDILMGLLVPTSGQIFVDGVEITAQNKTAWQLNIAHVPQNLFLFDATFAENIALGENIKDIDMEKVQRAAERAQISSFIESKEDRYYTRVGERGVSLSGGQRQRLALARALYKNTPILVLDEATSALDIKTEQEVMSAIQDLDSELTIVIVTHRLDSLKLCNVIYNMNNGCVLAKN